MNETIDKIIDCKIMMKDDDGNYVEVNTIPGDALCQTTISKEPERPERTFLIRPSQIVSFTGAVYFGKMLRCRSRKRLVKLLMSKGMYRNAAETVSRAVGKSRMTYDQYWKHYWFSGDPLCFIRFSNKNS